MTKLKKAGWIILGILVLLIIAGIFIPKEVDIKVSKKIEVPANYAYNIVNDLSTLGTWHAWFNDSSQVSLSLGDVVMGQGASCSWTRKDGQPGGQLQYVSSTKNESIQGLLTYDEEEHPFTMQFVSENANTEMKWEMQTKLSFPFNIFKPIYKYKVKKAYAQSMKAIETLAQPRMNGIYNGYEVKEVPYNERNFVMNRDEVALSNIQKFYVQNLGPIYQRAQEENLVIEGMPCGLFFSKNETKGVIDMAAAIPVLQKKDIAGLTSLTIPAGPALVIDYYGDYGATQQAHDAMEDYMRDRNLLYNSPVIEEYVTDPLKEKDPAKWLTKIIYYFSGVQ